jgi:hypothetical protein
MRMRKYLVLFGIVLMGALLFSCKDTKSQAIDYNDKIVGLQSKIGRSMLAFSRTFSSNNMTLMEKKYTELLDSIDFAISRAEAMEPFNGSSEFRDTAIRLFEFYQDISENEYDEILDIFSQDEITQDDAERIEDLAEGISEREKGLDYEFATVQKAFAQKHGIRLRDNKLQRQIDRI